MSLETIEEYVKKHTNIQKNILANIGEFINNAEWGNYMTIDIFYSGVISNNLLEQASAFQRLFENIKKNRG